MNIVFSLYAKIEGSVLFSNNKNEVQVYDKIIRYFSDSKNSELSFLFESSIEDAVLKMSLHPIENPILFTHDDENIIVEISTGFIGAGYHAWVISMLEGFGAKYNIYWHEVINKKDSTGYFKNKNFNLLSKYFTSILLDISDTLLLRNKEGLSNFMINFPEEYPIISSQYFAVTPLGYFSKNWFLDVLNYKDDSINLEKYAREFYIWNDQQMDDNFWYKTVIAMLWLYYPCREYLNEEERKFYTKILYALETAYHLNQHMNYPYDKWLDIASYLGDEDITNIVKKRMGDVEVQSNIGFCSELGITEIAAGFNIKMPISMIRYRDEQSSTTEFYNKNIHSIFQVYSFQNENENQIMEKVIEHIDKTGDKGLEMTMQIDNFKSKAYEKMLDNDKYLITSVVVNNNLALIGWFTYYSKLDKESIISFLKNITYTSN